MQHLKTHKTFLVCGISLFMIIICMNIISGARFIIYPTGDNATAMNRNTGSDNYALVDELFQDDDTTYVYAQSGNGFLIDRYDAYDKPTTGNGGTINNITVYIRARNVVIWAFSASAFHAGVNYSGTESTVNVIDKSDQVWHIGSNTFSTNPHTSSAWEWDEIDDLLIVVGAETYSGAGQGRITQVWAVIDYDLPTGEEIRPNNDIKVDLTRFPASGTHFSKVNESVFNESDYINLVGNVNFVNDTFGLTNTAVGSGDINSVTSVCSMRGGHFVDGRWHVFRYFLNISDTEDIGIEQRNILSGINYHSQTWNQNPDTGVNWTWDDIDNLNSGVSLACAFTGTWYNQCFQHYLIVNYSSAVAEDSCSPSSPLTSDHIFECSDNCVQSTELQSDGYDIIVNGTGTLLLTDNIINWTKTHIRGGCIVTCDGGCFK